MAQVNVNFRLEEEVKRRMERACKEMGLSMTTAFTMFATKVGNERRIPFEIAAYPAVSASQEIPLQEKREEIELLFTRMRRALTGIVTGIPAAASGLTVERIRLLCADTLKDQTASALTSLRTELSERKLSVGNGKDGRILQRYQTELSAMVVEVETLETMLLPLLKAGSEPEMLEHGAVRLTALSAKFPALQTILREFSISVAKCAGEGTSVQARLQQCVRTITAPDVMAELRILEALVRRRYELLDEQTCVRVEGVYLPAVEHTVEALGRAEREGEDTTEREALCLRAIQVISQTLMTAGQRQETLCRCDLESEVTALERFAALRGDIAGEPSAF